MKEKFLAYQLSKVDGYYRWTSTKLVSRLPKENANYLWVDSEEEAERLSNTRLPLNCFKLRAEGPGDVLNFLVAASGSVVTHKTDLIGNGPDCTLEFTTYLELSTVVRTLDSMIDLHVMAESVMPVEGYTGERLPDRPELCY